MLSNEINLLIQVSLNLEFFIDPSRVDADAVDNLFQLSKTEEFQCPTIWFPDFCGWLGILLDC